MDLGDEMFLTLLIACAPLPLDWSLHPQVLTVLPAPETVALTVTAVHPNGRQTVFADAEILDGEGFSMTPELGPTIALGCNAAEDTCEEAVFKVSCDPTAAGFATAVISWNEGQSVEATLKCNHDPDTGLGLDAWED